MPRDHVLKFKILKVTGANFDDATDQLEAMVEAFIVDAQKHNNFWEPVGRPAGWFNLGKFHMTQSLILCGRS